MADVRQVLDSVVVHDHNGHGLGRGFAESVPLQREMAVLALGRGVWAQRPSLRDFHAGVDPASHIVSANMADAAGAAE
jgi:hypothetical protein